MFAFIGILHMHVWADWAYNVIALYFPRHCWFTIHIAFSAAKEVFNVVFFNGANSLLGAADPRKKTSQAAENGVWWSVFEENCENLSREKVYCAISVYFSVIYVNFARPSVLIEVIFGVVVVH